MIIASDLSLTLMSLLLWWLCSYYWSRHVWSRRNESNYAEWLWVHIDGKHVNMWRLENSWNVCVCVRTASVSPLGLYGKAEVSTAYHFPGTDAPIHHPLSVWFQSVLYLLISPRRESGPRPGTKVCRKAACLSVIFINNLLLWIYNTPQDDTASSYEAAVRNTAEITRLKKTTTRRCPDGLIKPFWKVVILGHGITEMHPQKLKTKTQTCDQICPDTHTYIYFS